MHHSALDWPRSHDRDLDHQVVKALRQKPRQHRHLCAAFDLKHADRVGTAGKLVNGWILGRNARHDFERIEGFALDFAASTETWLVLSWWVGLGRVAG